MNRPDCIDMKDVSHPRHTDYPRKVTVLNSRQPQLVNHFEEAESQLEG